MAWTVRQTACAHESRDGLLVEGAGMRWIQDAQCTRGAPRQPGPSWLARRASSVAASPVGEGGGASERARGEEGREGASERARERGRQEEEGEKVGERERERGWREMDTERGREKGREGGRVEGHGEGERKGGRAGGRAGWREREGARE